MRAGYIPKKKRMEKLSMRLKGVIKRIKAEHRHLGVRGPEQESKVKVVEAGGCQSELHKRIGSPLLKI